MTYLLYGSPQSLFTRKLQTALEFYPLHYRFRQKRGSGIEEQLELRSGTHQMPVLQTPENWLLADTTPIIALLDARYPAFRLFPRGVDGFLVHLLEDIFDEWISRVMVHYRWRYPDTAGPAAEQLANGDPEMAARIRAWGPRACRATGTETAEAGADAEREYEFILQLMESQLQETRYLLGPTPTALDCAALGGLHAHMLNDHDPAVLMRSYKVVSQWAADNQQDAAKFPVDEAPQYEATTFARQFLERVAPAYKAFLLGNKVALAQGDKSFLATIYGHEVSFLARNYPENARQMLVDRLHYQLDDSERQQAIGLLDEFDLAECFAGAPGDTALTDSQH